MLLVSVAPPYSVHGHVSKSSLDLVKARAFAQRVVKVLEVMEEFQALTGETGDRIPENVRRLESSTLVTPEVASNVVFKNCYIYTPDGKRLLMPGVNFEIKEGESCLIMGPSGIGKSSLLRVLGYVCSNSKLERNSTDFSNF